MTHSQELDQLFAALSEFQSKVYHVGFDAKVKVKTKTGPGYSFEYATLGALIEATQAQLAEHGLSVSQVLDGDGITTIVGHKSGQFISGNFTLPFTSNMNAQDRGGMITYFRRYGYASALRLNSDKDDDANSAVGNEASFEKAPWEERKKASPKAKPKKTETSSDDISTTISTFTDANELVTWYNGEMKKASNRQEFNDKYFGLVRDRMAELKS